MSISSNDFRRNKFADLLQRDHTLLSAVLVGIEGQSIEVQARATRILNRPSRFDRVTSITGMAGVAVTEALQRIAGAFTKLGVNESDVEILVNLAPADLPKEGAALDLALAVIMLQAAGKLPDLPDQEEKKYVLIGEVGLHAEVRRIAGALALAHHAQPGQVLLVPNGNDKECALILAKPGHEGCRVCPVSRLDEALTFFRGEGMLRDALQETTQFESAIDRAIDFGQVLGQDRAKEAAIISAAGGHNLLLVGPPGEGKSMIAAALPGILPRLTDAEKVELTRIYSACGKLERDAMAVTRRPMRSIHNTITKQALVGGGSGVPKPGEITLSHLGVLFLDEVAEFSRATLETLRQPMESGRITISRAAMTLDFPSRFTLVAAMNPCPCGYFGSDRCSCREHEVKRYQKKISGPLLDRIDLQVELRALTSDERFAEQPRTESPQLRAQVERARIRQRDRLAGLDIPTNSAIPGGRVRDLCAFSANGFDKYKRVVDSSSLSTRTMDRLAKVSRTVADLAGSDEVDEQHVDRAREYVVGNIFAQFS